MKGKLRKEVREKFGRKKNIDKQFNSMKIFTIGHSTRSIEELIDILKNFGIKFVVDVRRFPSSKKFPWFGKDNLSKSLAENGIEYIHYPELGGFRKEGYANFAQSNEFAETLKRLVEIIDEKVSAIVCAERFFWRCHRKYIANELVKLGHNVVHILDRQKTYEHKLKEKELQEKMNLKIWCDKKAKKFTTSGGG